MDTSFYTMLEDGYKFLKGFEWNSTQHKHAFQCEKYQIVGRINSLILNDENGISLNTKSKRKILIEAVLACMLLWGLRKKKVTACSLEFTVNMLGSVLSWRISWAMIT